MKSMGLHASVILQNLKQFRWKKWTELDYTDCIYGPNKHTPGNKVFMQLETHSTSDQILTHLILDFYIND